VTVELRVAPPCGLGGLLLQRQDAGIFSFFPLIFSFFLFRVASKGDDLTLMCPSRAALMKADAGYRQVRDALTKPRSP